MHGSTPSKYTLYWTFFHHSRFLSNLRLPWKKQSCPEIFHWIEYTFYIQDFKKTCACPENRVSPENFHCIEYIFYHSGRSLLPFVLALKNRGCPEFTVVIIYFYHSGFLSNLRFPWKMELPWNFSLYWNIFYHSGFWGNLRLPWKTELPWYFHCIKHVFFIIQEFWVTCACPEKTELPWKVSLYGIYFLHSEFLSNLRLPWKTEGSLNLLYRIHIFIIQEFWVTCAFPEKQSCPGIFHCIEYTLYIQEIWETRACPEKQSCPEIFRCVEYTFYIQDFWATSAALKNRVALIFSLY